MPNRLASCTSPYLLQHASNPVDWWPWGPEAFAEARRRDVPVLVSIGYSACHWCHVMAHESFEDAEAADLVNAHFVAVKVDREEHPDVDAVYMRATQALTGRGGWPMTVFVTPQGEPFFAGTYFPPEPVEGMPSFSQVVEALASAWDARREEVVASASAITEQLAQINALPVVEAAPNVWEALDALGADFDLLHGGFGAAPKFPAPLAVDALLIKGDPETLDLAQRTLEAMARGGVHDQIGGGFHRYAVDAGWVVPHFEKMLYDNALLLGAYARGWRRTPQHDEQLRWLLERAVRGIVGWLQREMVTPQGAFAASLDADSADIRGMAHEGIYYVWSLSCSRTSSTTRTRNGRRGLSRDEERHVRAWPVHAAVAGRAGRDSARRRGISAARGARAPVRAPTRRQGGGVLERLDDRLAGLGIGCVRRTGLAEAGRGCRRWSPVARPLGRTAAPHSPAGEASAVAGFVVGRRRRRAGLRTARRGAG